MPIKIIHGIYTGNEVMEEAQDFKDYIIEKHEKFNRKYDQNFVVFSVGIDLIHKLKTIAVVHAFDIFDPDIAKEIIEGRMARMLGELEWEDEGGIVHRTPYDPLPDYIKVINYIY